ncbi:hypothetical protein GCM10023169_26960 [Georgenia halophila]|uniref:Uncharacterized protein n=1 Tax=Georgenia halophila TaxID=620889 RepID=A0ABP8LF32_9MICO
MKKLAVWTVPLLACGLLGGVLLVLFLGAGLNAGAQQRTCAQGQSIQAVGTVPAGLEVAGYTGEQLHNASIIMQVGEQLGIDAHGQTIGVMTAMGESSLRNISHGDAAGPDSAGLFQQRPSQGWGTREQVMDPVHASEQFFDRLRHVDGWRDLEPTLAANRVQRNADPLHYREHWDTAVEVVTALADQGPGGDALPVADEGGYDIGAVKPQTQALADEVGAHFGLDPADVGGYRDSAADSGGHPAGLAVDFMTWEDLALGDAIVDYVMQNAERLSVEYIIWRQAIWMADRADEGWQPMEDRGSDSANHFDHPHVNLRSTPSEAADLSPVGCLNASISLAGLSPTGDWVKPTDGPISSRYGPRWGSFHAGTDFAAACGMPIYAATDGVVTYTGSGHPRYGLSGHVIVVDHGEGLETTYNHMFAAGVHVRPGQQVSAGQQIGAVGDEGNSTGCHLHFGVYVGGQHTDPGSFMAAQDVPLG